MHCIYTFPTRFGIWRHTCSLGAWYKPATVGDLKQPVLPYHPTIKSSSIGRSQLHQLLIKSHIARLKGVLLIRPPHHTPVPPSPLHHFLATLSIPLYSRSEGLLMAKNSRRTRGKRTKQHRRMSLVARQPTMTADWRDVM